MARALDKLQGLLARRGITSTTAALGVALGGQAGVAAPAGLAASVTAGALAGVGTGLGALGSFLAFMSTAKLVGLVAVIMAGLALFEARALREARTALEAGLEAADLRAKVRDLERQLRIQAQRATAAEEDTANLLAAVQQSRSAAKAGKDDRPITKEVVEARYKRGQELARTGQPAEALKEFLWCFDEGMVRVTSYLAVRTSFLLGEITRLGSNYPPALDALRARRDAEEQKMAVSVSDTVAAATFATLNSAWKDDSRTLAIYDRLEPTDERRLVMGPAVFDLLVEAGRYTDAASAKTGMQMKAEFDSASEPLHGAEDTPNRDEIKKAIRTHAVDGAIKNIEVLAGAGESDRARELIARLLAYDGTAETREKLRVRLAKFGRTEWLPAAGR